MRLDDLLAVLLVGSLVAGCGGGGTVPPRPTAQLLIVAGEQQTGIVGQELAAAVQVKVVDDQGQPVRGQLVNFRVTSGGGSVFAGSSISGADGIVRERWTLGTSTQVAQVLEARAVDNTTGAPLIFATLTATPLPDVPAELQVVSGDGQRTAGGQAGALPAPLVLSVLDRYGNPAAGAEVTWAAAAGDEAAPPSSPVASDGTASTTWLIGSAAGEHALAALAGGLQATFTANRPSDVGFTATCALTESCTFGAACSARYTGEVVFDASQALELWLPVEVHNLLPNNADPIIGRVNTNDAHLTSFEVSYVGFGLATATANVNYRVPAAGSATVGLWVVPHQIALLAEPSTSTSAEAHVVGRGFLEDGTTFSTDEYVIPFTWCSHCVTPPPACTPPTVATVTCGSAGIQPAIYACQ